MLIHRPPPSSAPPNPASDLLPGPVSGEKFRGPAGRPSSRSWLVPRLTWVLCPARSRGRIPGSAGRCPEVPGFPGPGQPRVPPRIPLEGKRPAARRESLGPGTTYGGRHVAVGLEGKSLSRVNARRPAFFSSESPGIGRLYSALISPKALPPPQALANYSLTRVGFKSSETSCTCRLTLNSKIL